MSFGLNLYSIRNLMQTEESFLAAAKRLKEAGYSYLQFSGSPLGAESIKRVSEECDMPVVLTHMPMDRILHDTDALMQEHLLYGCKNIGLGMMPVEIILDEAKFKQTVEELNRAAEHMEKSGFRFFYHHHHFEFYRHGAETAFDYMLKNAPHINFTADTFWLQYGGADVLATLRKMKGRIACVHLKDYAILKTADGGLAPTFAPVGDGVLDFDAILAEMKTLGVEYYLVEQDNAPDKADAVAEVSRSATYLKGRNL